jgi:anti-sigma regulatory factor (Ser/Thr protein kinase)
MSLLLGNNLSELPRIHSIVQSWLDERGAGPNLRYDTDLVIEEIITNLVKYAWPGGGEHTIRIHVGEEEGHLVLAFEDDGRPFDPRQSPEPELPKTLEHPPGGLGIHLIKLAVDRIEYRSERERNTLTLRLREPLGERPGS